MNSTYPNNRDYILSEYRALKSAKGWYIGRMGMGRGRYWEHFSRDSPYFVCKSNAEYALQDYILADADGAEEVRAVKTYLDYEVSGPRMYALLQEI